MNQSGLLFTGTVSLVMTASAASLQAATIYDVAGDYLDGWSAGNNPNAVWTYGWSAVAGGALTLYSANGHDVAGFPQLDSWSDPTNRVSNVPDVYLNTGPVFTANTVDSLPAGALALHGGGSACVFACFSEVVWTAPGTGLFNLAVTFTGRQFGVNGLVEIIDTSGGAQFTLLSGSVTDQTSQSLSEQISVNAGDTLTFAARQNAGSNGDTTQLVATLTSVSSSEAPEPSTSELFLAVLGWLGYRRLRARAARQNRLRLSAWFLAAIAFVAVVFPGFADAQTAPVAQSGQTAGDTERLIERTYTDTMVRARFEPPVEKRTPDGAPWLSADGRRQFELRIHEDDGTDTMEPVTPTSSQDKMDHPTVFHREVRNAQGELIRHHLYTLLPPEQGEMMMVVTTIYKSAATATGSPQPQNPPPAAIPNAVYRSSKYPVHADKDSYSRFFYHLTLAEAQQPVTVIPRVPTDMMKQDSKLARPGKMVQSALGIPNYSANIMAGIDYSTLTKNGDRWRDWMAIDARNNITYFQLTPAHKLAKDKDGAWDIHVSRDPPPLFDLKRNAGKQ